MSAILREDCSQLQIGVMFAVNQFRGTQAFSQIHVPYCLPTFKTMSMLQGQLKELINIMHDVNTMSSQNIVRKGFLQGCSAGICTPLNDIPMAM